MRRMLTAALVAAGLAVVAPLVHCQTVTLTVTGASSALPAPTFADYVAGYLVDPTPLTYSVRLNSGRSGCVYTVDVRVRASSATIGSGKPVSDLEWSTAGAFTAMTTSFVTVDTHTLTRQSTTSSGTITFRMTLNWLDTSASYAGSTLQFSPSATTTGSGC